jgi:hypothetical protein
MIAGANASLKLRRSRQCPLSIKSPWISWSSSGRPPCRSIRYYVFPRGAIIELDATEADEVKVLANNLPVASGVVLVDRNRIAVEVKQMLPRTPGTR